MNSFTNIIKRFYLLQLFFLHISQVHTIHSLRISKWQMKKITETNNNVQQLLKLTYWGQSTPSDPVLMYPYNNRWFWFRRWGRFGGLSFLRWFLMIRVSTLRRWFRVQYVWLCLLTAGVQLVRVCILICRLSERRVWHGWRKYLRWIVHFCWRQLWV